MRKVVSGDRSGGRRPQGEGFCKLVDGISISMPLLSFLLFGVSDGELASLGIILRTEGRPQSWTSSQCLQMTISYYHDSWSETGLHLYFI